MFFSHVCVSSSLQVSYVCDKLHCISLPLCLILLLVQGDKERELGLQYSPLCDRNSTLVAESQIGSYFHLITITILLHEITSLFLPCFCLLQINTKLHLCYIPTLIPSHSFPFSCINYSILQKDQVLSIKRIRLIDYFDFYLMKTI